MEQWPDRDITRHAYEGRQRRGATAAAVVVLAAALWTWAGGGVHVADPAAGPSRVRLPADVLVDQVDPNTAEARRLAALPGLGPAKAASIHTYADAARRQGRRAFASASDLEAVRGIGPATAERLRPHLRFDSAAE